MSRDLCSGCGAVVSTTADPNDKEGFFVSLEDAEAIEVELQADPDGAFSLRGLLRKRCLPLVFCVLCRVEMIRRRTHGD